MCWGDGDMEVHRMYSCSHCLASMANNAEARLRIRLTNQRELSDIVHAETSNDCSGIDGMLEFANCSDT